MTVRGGGIGNKHQPIIISPYMPTNIPARAADHQSSSNRTSPQPQERNNRQADSRRGRRQNHCGPAQADAGRLQDEQRLRIVGELADRLAPGNVPLGRQRRRPERRPRQPDQLVATSPRVALPGSKPRRISDCRSEKWDRPRLRGLLLAVSCSSGLRTRNGSGVQMLPGTTKS